MDERLERIKSWIGGNKTGPFSVDIIPTNRCNFKCLACHQRSITKEDYYMNELTLEKYKKIVDEASDLNVRVIQILGGGEPFLRKDIIEILKSIKNKKLRGYAITNGSALNLKTIKKLVDINWDELAISLDASDAKTHDYLRQKKGSFDRIIMAIKAINEEKAKQKKEKPKIIINYLITNLNYNRIVDLVGLCNKLKVQEINLMCMLNSSEFVKKLELNREQHMILLKQMKTASVMSKKYNIKNNFSEISDFIMNTSGKKNKETKQICLEPFWHLVIGTSGYAVPCNMSLDNCIFPKNNLAENVNKKSLKEIWYGKRFEQFRKDIFNPKKRNTLCSECCSTIITTSNSDRISLKIGEKQ